MEYEDLGNFKYRIIKGFVLQTKMRPKKKIVGKFATLTTKGRLYIHKGFCWDGASGARDTKNIMKPSCCHDVGCAWYLAGLIDDELRGQFDDLFERLLDRQVKKDKLSDFRRDYLVRAVKINTKIRYGI